MRKLFFIFLIFFSFSTYGGLYKNLVTNGDFSLGLTRWKKTGSNIELTINNYSYSNIDGQTLTVSASAAGQIFESDDIKFPTDSYINKSCSIEFDYNAYFTPGQLDWYITIWNVTDNVEYLNPSQRIIPTRNYTTINLSTIFICPVAKTLRIRFVSTGSLISSLKFDNFYLGETRPGSGKVSSEVQTYIPTTQGLGTITNSEVYWSRNGSYLEVNGKFTVGTTSAVEARIYFPPGLTSENFTQGIRRAGEGIRVTTTSNDINILVEPNVNYFTLDYQHDGGTNGMTKQTGANILASGNVFTFQARVKIQGWVATDSYVEQRCKSDIECSNSFSAKVSSAGVVTDENNLDWINGNCTNGSAGSYTCNFVSGVFSSVPNCTVYAASNGGGVASSAYGSITNSSFTFYIFNSSNTGVNLASTIRCERSTDSKTRTTIQASFAPLKVVTTNTLSSSIQTIPHGLGRIPFLITPSLVVNTAIANWSIGDIIPRWVDGLTGIADSAIFVGADATNIYVIGNSGNISIKNKTTGANTSAAESNFKMQVEYF